MHVFLILGAVAIGLVAGLFLPRAAYRLAVLNGQEPRGTCPSGHVLERWLATARCTSCSMREPDGAVDARCDEAVDLHGDEAVARRAGKAAEGRGGEALGARGAWFGPSTAAVVAGTAAICAALAFAVGPHPELAAWLALAPPVVLLVLIDRRVHRLPDTLTLPLAAASVLLLGIASLLPGATGSWPRAMLGGLTLGGAYFALFLIHPKGIGFGDVKLALTLGTALGWYGWDVLAIGAFAGQVLAAGHGAGLVILRRASLKTEMPLGPHLAGGALVGVLLGAAGVAGHW